MQLSGELYGGHNGDLEGRRDFRVDLHRNGVVAGMFDRIGDDFLPVDFDPRFLEFFEQLLGGNGTEELPFFAGLVGNGEGERLDLGGKHTGRFQHLVLFEFQVPLGVLQCFGIPVGGLNDQPLGKQGVAGVAGGYLNDVADGKISPWIILNSSNGKAMLQKFNDEQLSAIGTVIDPQFWSSRFKKLPADVELVRQIVKESNI